MAIPIPGRTGSTRSTELGALNEIIRKLLDVKNEMTSNSSATLTEQQSQTALLTTIDAALTLLTTNVTISHEVLTNPVNEVFTNFKKISFVCSGTIDVIVGGNTITYPYSLGASTILGSEFECDANTADTIEFDGTGTVLVTIIS